MAARYIETVGTTPKQHHRHMAADRDEPPSAHGRHPPVRGVAWPSRRHAKAFHRRCCTGDSRWRMGGRFHRHGRIRRRHGIRPNRIKASLSAFQRWEVKVLGFGMKARLRPQRMASRGCSDPFALVGAIGEACGEASGVFFLGPPPGCWCVLPLLLWCVNRVGVLTWFMC